MILILLAILTIVVTIQAVLGFLILFETEYRAPTWKKRIVGWLIGGPLWWLILSLRAIVAVYAKWVKEK